MEEYLIRRVSDQSYKDICYLFKERGVHYSKEFVQKKFDTSFAGQKNIGYIAYHAATGEPASHYSVFPCFLEVRGKKILAAQSGDTITHERHQRKGLFIQLAEKCYSLARECGIEMVFGFPNKNSYHGFIDRLNWIYSESFRSFIIPVKTLPIQKIASRLPGGVAFYHSVIRSFPAIQNANHREFANSLLQEGFAGVVHDADFFRYKRFTRNYVAKVDHVLIWFKIEHGILVGDIQHDFEFDGERIVAALKKLAHQTGNNSIMISLCPGVRLERFLSGYVTATAGAAACWLNLSSDFSPGSIKFTTADLDTF